VGKNLFRLAGAWADAVGAAVRTLRTRARAWVDGELETHDRLLSRQPAEADAFRAALRRLEDASTT
jgi:hypothetical protein